MTDDAARAAERTRAALAAMDIWTTACQELLAAVAKDERHGGPPRGREGSTPTASGGKP